MRTGFSQVPRAHSILSESVVIAALAGAALGILTEAIAPYVAGLVLVLL